MPCSISCAPLQGLVAIPPATIFLRMVRTYFEFPQLPPPPLHAAPRACSLPLRFSHPYHSSQYPASSVTCSSHSLLSNLSSDAHPSSALDLSYACPHSPTFLHQESRRPSSTGPTTQEPTDRFHAPSPAGLAARSQDRSFSHTLPHVQDYSRPRTLFAEVRRGRTRGIARHDLAYEGTNWKL